MKEIRGSGLWWAVELDGTGRTGREISLELLARGILAKDTHTWAIRFAPPLVVSEADLDHALATIVDVLTSTEHARTARVGPMAMEPDTKDWTWVLDRPCPRVRVRRLGRSTAPSVAARAARPGADLDWQALGRPGPPQLRPASGRLVARLEYACHVRDVAPPLRGPPRA